MNSPEDTSAKAFFTSGLFCALLINHIRSKGVVDTILLTTVVAVVSFGVSMVFRLLIYWLRK
jgi:hypothetical protein